MPVNRYQIRDVYSMADPELYKAADKDDPEALLEGVAMAGLVGVIRQLGDLAEFAAEIFHELHEEVTATAARGHGLLVRAQQLQLEIPSIERSFMSQTCHSTFSPTSGIDWHTKRQTTHNLITTGDLPRYVMNSYEECRGPPRLFLLDKFDVGGAGACLKRYTDPSFYKVEVSSYEIENAETQRDKRIRKNKKTCSQWKSGGTPEVSPNSKAKLHQLFMEDRIQNGTIEPTHRVKLKKRPNKSPFGSATRESYMNKLLNSPSEGKIVPQVPFHPSIIPVPSDSPNQLGFEIFKDAIASPFNLATQSRSPSVSGRRNPAGNLAGKVTDLQSFDLTTSGSLEVDEEIKTDGIQNDYRSDDVASEMDNYVDALSTMESELETAGEHRAKTDLNINQETFSDQLQSQFSDSELTGSTEIPFHPRVPLEKIPRISYGASIDVNQRVILEKGSEDDENVKVKEHQIDFLSPAGSLLSFQFFGNFEREVENEHPNDGYSPKNCLPNILETTDRIRKDNHSTGSEDSRCSSPHSGISHVNEQPFSVSLAKNDSVVEETLDSCEICSLPEEQLKETGNGDVLHILDSTEAKASYFSEDGTASSNSEIGIVIHAVSDLNDADKSGELKEREIVLANSKIAVVSTPVSVPEDVDRNGDKALSTHEDDTELEGIEDPVDPKMEKSVVVLLPLHKNENSASDASVDASHDLTDDDDVDGNDDNALSTLDDTGLEGTGKEDSVDLEEMKKSTCDTSLAASYDLNDDNDVDLVKEIKAMTVTEKPPMLELPQVEEKDDPQLLFASAGSRFSSQSDSPTHADLETDFNTYSEPYSVNLPSQSIVHKEDPQGKPMIISVSEKVPTLESPQTTSHDIDLFDQVKHQFHSDPYSVKVSSQSEADPQGKPITVSVSEKLPTLELPQAISNDIDLFDQVKHQFNSDPNSINLASQSVLPEKPPTLELPQAISHDIDLSDQIKHQLPPVFPGFSILPNIPPAKLEDTPPLPPLPPMQWRMKKLQSPLLTPTDGGQPSDNNFPPFFQSKPNEIKNAETKNEKFEHDGGLHAQDHDKKSGSTEAKFAENLVPQEADEMPTNIRPMKIQRPRSPLIDAVATHDKSKLRKVAMSQITKGQENDKLLEQIRTKSYNLKPAVKTRPNIQGPTTNVRLAAILEKANAIRQAFAGSDDDDDSDSWSDS